jgi:amino-acid N-acetyltransferase
MSRDVRIDRAGPQDLDAVLALLAEHKLPLDGLSEHLATTLVARDAGRVTGSAALEVYADGALLRSVVVAHESQGQGLGRTITEAAIALGQQLHVPAIYLLTTTAPIHVTTRSRVDWPSLQRLSCTPTLRRTKAPNVLPSAAPSDSGSTGERRWLHHRF